MTRRMLSMLFILVLLASAALAQDAGEWDRDPKQHWHTNEAGEKTDAAAHVMQEDIYCTVCGSEIWVYDDGASDVYNYSEAGDLTRYSAYDAAGNLVDEYRYVHEYNADGVKQKEQTYYAGALLEEIEYAVSPLGDVVPRLQTAWYPDGTGAQNEYDEYGSVVRITTTDEAGNLTFEETTEYTYGEDGVILGTTVKGQYTDGDGYKTLINQYGDTTFNAFYNADGSVIFESRSEFEYDPYGSKLWEKTYMDGVLLSESIYVVESDEFGSWSREKTYTEYNEDGTRYVVEYNEYGEEISAALYDAGGSIIPEPESGDDFDVEGFDETDDTLLEGGAYLIGD